MAGGRRLAGQGAFWGLDVGLNPTDRAKTNVMVEGQGGPLDVSTAPANWQDARCPEDSRLSVVVERPAGQAEQLLLDNGFDNPTGREAAKSLGYVAYIRTI